MTPTAEEKVKLLRELTRGAHDVFAMRTEGVWRPVYAELPDEYLRMHLTGTCEIGSYPLLPVESGLPDIWWVAADFDGKRDGSDWERDVKRATRWLLDTGACVFVNLSRSAKGAHVRVLFREPVPAWMARRWMMSWLEEAGVASKDGEGDEWDPIPPSFDRLIPPQDTLNSGFNRHGKRLPGNLIGSPLNGGLARKTGGTLPLDPQRAAMGDFAPDGEHWRHVTVALEAREWGVAELRDAMGEMPEDAVVPPTVTQQALRLPVVASDCAGLDHVTKFCEFFRHMSSGGQTYHLRVALASQLHRFGEEGRAVFHQISATDPRYDAKETDKKWEDTRSMHPVRCETLVSWGYRCKNLMTKRCNGCGAPTYFADHSYAEVL
jgi:hypothetical protein